MENKQTSGGCIRGVEEVKAAPGPVGVTQAGVTSQVALVERHMAAGRCLHSSKHSLEFIEKNLYIFAGLPASSRLDQTLYLLP